MSSGGFFRRSLMTPVYRRLTAAELFALARDGNHEALLVLVVKQYAPIVTTIRRTLQPHEPVEDVALDVFSALWEDRHAVQPASVEGWLHQTARHLAARHVGRAVTERKNRPRVVPVDPETPPEAAERTDAIAAVRRAVAELSTRDQDVLRASDEFTSDAAAAASLNLNLNTYRSRLGRARGRLQVILERFGFGPLLGLFGAADSLFGRGVRSWAVKLLIVGATVAGAFAVRRPDGPRTLAVPQPSPPVVAPAPAVVRKDVVQRMLACLKQSAVGNAADVRLIAATATPTRHEVRVACVHRIKDGDRTLYEYATELRFRMHTATRAIRVEVIDPGRPPRLLQLDQVVSLHPLSVAGLGTIPGGKFEWPGLREAAGVLHSLGEPGDAGLTAAVHEVCRATVGRDATPEEIATQRTALRAEGKRLRDFAENLLFTTEYLDRFVHPFPPREAARLYLERLAAPGSFSNAQVDQLAGAFEPNRNGELFPHEIHRQALGFNPRSRWAEASLDD